MKILKINTEDRRLGDFGEREATRFLKKRGYRILERNYVAFDHEVDIIAEGEGVIAFIEVKTRSQDKLSPREPRPASAVTPAKQRSIMAAAKAYIGSHTLEGHMRLDVIEVYADTAGKHPRVLEIKHLKDAFNRNTAYSRK